MIGILLQLAALFGMLSLLAFGGGTACCRTSSVRRSTCTIG